MCSHCGGAEKRRSAAAADTQRGGRECARGKGRIHAAAFSDRDWAGESSQTALGRESAKDGLESRAEDLCGLDSVPAGG